MRDFADRFKPLFWVLSFLGVAGYMKAKDWIDIFYSNAGKGHCEFVGRKLCR